MEEKTYWIQVRVSKKLNPSTDLIVDENNQFNFSDEFVDVLHEADAEFREPIMTFLNDALGLHTWAISFSEGPGTGMYDARLFQNEGRYEEMVAIIQERMPGKVSSFRKGGTVADYINNA